MDGSETLQNLPRSVAGLFELEVFVVDSGAAPWLLIEIPHGATQTEHYRILGERLKSRLPKDLEAFFHINTDIGAPEVGRDLARRLAGSGTANVAVLCCQVPRTFIDCNRALEHPGAGAVTPGLPEYIDHEDDRRFLLELHDQYTRAAKQAYAAICDGEQPGLAINLHTFAPRSIAITKVKSSIVEELKAAYAPGVYTTWPERPQVDLICRTADDRLLAPEGLVQLTRRQLTEAGFEVKENATYRLYRATMGYWHSKPRPGRVLCVEIRRDLLTVEFRPFEAMQISADKAGVFAQALAEAIRAFAASAP